MGDMYALDFDGVLCDSCGESSLSAVTLKGGGQACSMEWNHSLEDSIVDQMHIVRPVVETGYENVLLVRLLLEMKIPSVRKSSVAEGLTVQGILDNWFKIKPVIMAELDEKRDQLIDLFGKVRDEWIDSDLAGWIGANRCVAPVNISLAYLHILSWCSLRPKVCKLEALYRDHKTALSRTVLDFKECHQGARVEQLEPISWGLGL